jgi:hypothetical protein
MEPAALMPEPAIRTRSEGGGGLLGGRLVPGRKPQMRGSA